MNYRLLWVVIATVQLSAFALDEAPLAPAVVDKSTEPATTIDNWVPKAPPKPAPETVPVVPPEVVGKAAVPVPTPPAVVPSPAPPVSPSVVVPAAAPLPPSMNEMTGKIESIDDDAKTIRLSVEGGFNPQFDYNDQTIVLYKGIPIRISDLQHDDKVIVRYVGKDLVARQIDRVKKAPTQK